MLLTLLIGGGPGKPIGAEGLKATMKLAVSASSGVSHKSNMGWDLPRPPGLMAAITNVAEALVKRIHQLENIDRVLLATGRTCR